PHAINRSLVLLAIPLTKWRSPHFHLAAWVIAVVAGCRMIRADGLTVISTSLGFRARCPLRGQSLSSKCSVDPCQRIRNRRNLRTGNGNLLFFPAKRASK